MVTIDTLDDRILAELQSNGRLTMKALAERVGLSSPAMIERVRRLEERGVLAGYRAIVDPHALGRTLTALIFVELDRRHYDAFINRLRSEPAVEECHRVTGDKAFLVKAHVSSTDELEALVDDLQDVGAKCSTNIVLSTPITGAPIVPPEGAVSQRTRLTRRRRRTNNANRAEEAAPKSENGTASRRRTRRKAAAASTAEGEEAVEE